MGCTDPFLQVCPSPPTVYTVPVLARSSHAAPVARADIFRGGGGRDGQYCHDNLHLPAVPRGGDVHDGLRQHHGAGGAHVLLVALRRVRPQLQRHVGGAVHRGRRLPLRARPGAPGRLRHALPLLGGGPLPPNLQLGGRLRRRGDRWSAGCLSESIRGGRAHVRAVRRLHGRAHADQRPPVRRGEVGPKKPDR